MQIRDRIKELRRVKASELRPHPANWRVHPDSQKNALRGILSELGYADALIARECEDGSLMLLDGHLRAETTPEMMVPVLVTDLTEEEGEKLLVTLDPLAAMAEANKKELEGLLAAVETSNEDLDKMLKELGEANGIIHATNGDPAEDPGPQIDRAAELQAKWKTERGQLWIIGKHRLLCGDSTKAEDVARVMGGEEAALFSTDPPYLCDYTGADRPNDSGKDWSDSYHEVAIQDGEDFFRQVFSCAIQHLKENAAWYCWHGHKRAALIERIWAELGILNHQQIIWLKPCAVHTYVYWPWAHEPCLMGWKKGNKPDHDGDNSHTYTSVWQCDWEGKARVVGNNHPTQKPVEIFARPMRKHTQPDDIAYEPFAGSGSQFVAGEQLGRRVFGIELEPKYVAVCLERLAGMGLEPQLS